MTGPAAMSEGGDEAEVFPLEEASRKWEIRKVHIRSLRESDVNSYVISSHLSLFIH